MSSPSKPIAHLSCCRRDATTICPRPGLQVVTRYTSHTHMDPSLIRCLCWPASTANQSGPATLTFDLLTLKVVSESRVTWATSVLGFYVQDLGTIYATDWPTDVRRASLLNAPGRGGRHSKSISRSIAALIWNETWHASCNRAQNLLSYSYRKIRRQSTILHIEYWAWLIIKNGFFSAPCFLSYWHRKYKTIEKHRSGGGNRTCEMLLNLTKWQPHYRKRQTSVWLLTFAFWIGNNM